MIRVTGLYKLNMQTFVRYILPRIGPPSRLPRRRRRIIYLIYVKASEPHGIDGCVREVPLHRRQSQYNYFSSSKASIMVTTVSK